MGRYYWDKKNTVEDCRSVSISFLRKRDFFCGPRSGTLTWTNWYGEETASIGIVVSTFDEENFVRFHCAVTDRNGRVDFSDLAIFASHWLWTGE